MSKCGGCGKFLSGGASCSKCKAMFHKQCVNLPSIGATPKNWLCPCCVASAPRTDNTHTPVKASLEPRTTDSPKSPQPELFSQTQFQDDPKIPCTNTTNNDLVLQEIRALRNDMNTLRKDFGSLRDVMRDEIKDLKELYQKGDVRMNEMSNRIDTQESRLMHLEEICTASQRDTAGLKIEVELLKRELDNREQLALANDIEISGVTEHSGENLMHITMCLMTAIGAKDIDERDIVEARRVGPVRVGLDGRPVARPLVVRVTRRGVHQQMLRCARTRRNVKTTDIDVAGNPRPVYINERLTRKNRLLFGQSRTLCKQHKWNFAWTREGKVFIREANGKPGFRISALYCTVHIL